MLKFLASAHSFSLYKIQKASVVFSKKSGAVLKSFPTVVCLHFVFSETFSDILSISDGIFDVCYLQNIYINMGGGGIKYQ